MSGSKYAKRMAQLSARIFGEMPIKDKTSSNLHLIQRLQVKPVYKQIEYSANYYPRHQEVGSFNINAKRLRSIQVS